MAKLVDVSDLPVQRGVPLLRDARGPADSDGRVPSLVRQPVGRLGRRGDCGSEDDEGGDQGA